MPPFARAFALTTALALSAPALADAPIGDAIQSVPIFDAHVHYKEPAWEAFPVPSVIELMDRSGVAMGLVSSTPDEGTIMLWEYAPNRIVPELRPYHGDVNSGNWTQSETIVGYLEDRLARYPHQGIGEFHIHRLDPFDEPLFREVIRMAKERDIYLHVHTGAAAVAWLYELDPEVKMIWAHAGLGESARNVYRVMEAFPTLMADTSLREYEIDTSGDGLNPEWQKIIYAFQDRLMVGSDTWVNGQWEDYAEIIASNRRWLAKLPRDVAEKIAYRNAERAFGREVTMDLIGKK
ncbi:amidohydrolase family protein [Shimia sp. SDUM112013]|uniref:amidohydrolase family protein n=1 Tax=Shimia sp. SDUM112013 TaxID=3136160 RepID=UPI0032F06E6F